MQLAVRVACRVERQRPSAHPTPSLLRCAAVGGEGQEEEEEEGARQRSSGQANRMQTELWPSGDRGL